MRTAATLTLGALVFALLTVAPPPAAAPQARAEEVPGKYKPMIEKGLKWLAKEQARDGHWSQNEQYPITMTALAGMAMLMEGSTIREGQYSNNIRRAVDYLMTKSQPNGMIGTPNTPGESGRYMYGHGFSTLFLACAYGEEEDIERRKKLEDIITRACKFIHDAQTNRGGWGYVAAREGNNFDEGSVTITQVQALRAARNAGIVVPQDAIKNAVKYLEQSTNGEGGVIYSLAGGGGGSGRPALTAAAISCGFSAGEYNNPLVKKWFKFCERTIPILGAGRMGHDEYTHYYYAQSVYMLGDDGWAKMFGGDPKSAPVTWSKYREATFEHLMRTQGAEGSWSGGHVGPVLITSMYLTMLQLDNATLPIYQR